MVTGQYKFRFEFGHFFICRARFGAGYLIRCRFVRFPDTAQCYKHLFTIKSKFIMSYVSQFIVRKNDREDVITSIDEHFSQLVRRIHTFLRRGYEVEHVHTHVCCR